MTDATARTMYTPETIQAACRAIHDAGGDLTLRKLRQRLGGGSHTTLLRELQAFRDAGHGGMEIANTPPPQEILSGLRDVAPRMWQEALECARKSVTQEMNRLRDQLTASQHAEHELAERMDGLDDQVRRADAERDRALAHAAQLQVDVASLRSELIHAHTEATAARHAGDLLQAELHQCQAERDRVQTDNLAHQERCRSLESHLAAMTSTCASHVQTMEAMAAERHTTETRLEQILATHADVLKATEANRMHLEEQITVLEGRSERHLSLASNTSAALTELRAAHAVTESELATTTVALTHLRTECHHATRERDQADARAQRWELLATGLGGSLTKLQESMAEIQRSIDKQPPTT
jgi:chromosome segregation ATPase